MQGIICCVAATTNDIMDWHGIGYSLSSKEQFILTQQSFGVLMKIISSLIAVFFTIILFGCSDNMSAVGVPASSSDASLTKPFMSLPIDEILFAPDGTKFRVVGSVDYKLSSSAGSYALSTYVDVVATRAGDGALFSVMGAKEFPSIFTGESNQPVVQEHGLVGIGRRYATSMLHIEYSVEDQGVTIKLMKIVGAEAY